MFWQIWVQKLASGAIERSVSHFTVGIVSVVSEFVMILYILESSFFDDWILIKSEHEDGRFRFVFLISNAALIEEISCAYSRN